MENFEETFTAQGRDTSVPVGAASARTGSSRPSSSDCSKQLNEEFVDPFKRRDSLARTPPKVRQEVAKDTSRCREDLGLTADGKDGKLEMPPDQIGGSVNSDEESDCVFIGGNTATEGIRKKSKRKRVWTPEKKEDPDKELLELRSMVEGLVKTTKKMKSLIEANPNTKIELKKEVVKIKNQVEVIRAKCKEWDMYPREQAAREIGNKVQTMESGCQAEITLLSPVRRSVGIQVTEEDIESETKIKEEVTRILGEGTTLDEINSVLDKYWPEDVYSSVKMEQGNPLQVENDCDLILIVKSDSRSDKGLLKGMAAKYPEIDEIIGQGMKKDQLDFIETVTRSVTSRRGVEEIKKYIYLLPYEGETGDVEDRRSLYRLLLQMREIIRKSSRKKIVMASQEGLDRDPIKKLAEYTLGKMDLQIRYVMPRDEGMKRYFEKGRKK